MGPAYKGPGTIANPDDVLREVLEDYKKPVHRLGPYGGPRQSRTALDDPAAVRRPLRAVPGDLRGDEIAVRNEMESRKNNVGKRPLVRAGIHDRESGDFRRLHGPDGESSATATEDKRRSRAPFTKGPSSPSQLYRDPYRTWMVRGLATEPCDARDVLSRLPSDSLIIHSRSALAALGISPDSRFVAADQTTMNPGAIDLILSELAYRPSGIVSFGGGRATDIAKYAAAKQAVPLTAIPSILSTNASFTDKTCLLEGGSKTTFDAKAPDKVLVDRVFLDGCRREHNLAGLGESWSFHTALFDWKLADAAGIEPVDLHVYALSRAALDFALDHGQYVYGPGVNGFHMLLNMLAFTGFITNVYGSGRPESGSEHIFAKVLEERCDVVHGTAVALGVLLMSRLQSNEDPRIIREILRSGQVVSIEAIPRADIAHSLLDLQPRAGRYTVLDTVNLFPASVEALLEGVERDHDLHFA